MRTSFLQLPLWYLTWHYTRAWADMVRLYRNLFWFLSHFFSIQLLSSTLFASWHRRHESASAGMGGVFGSIILNLILHVVGFFARLFVILVGLAALILCTAFFLFFLVLWPFLPLLALALVLNGAVGLLTF